MKGDVVYLPVLRAVEVSSTTDRFRCEPYGCTILAGACVGRQVRVRELGSDAARLSSMSKCWDCEDGRAVSGRLGAKPVIQLCSEEGCDRAVADPAETLCEPCRRGKQLPRAHARPPRPLPELPAPAPKGDPMPREIVSEEEKKRRRNEYQRAYREKQRATSPAAAPAKPEAARKKPRRRMFEARPATAASPAVVGSFSDLAGLVDRIGIDRVLTILRIVAGDP